MGTNVGRGDLSVLQCKPMGASGMHLNTDHLGLVDIPHDSRVS